MSSRNYSEQSEADLLNPSFQQKEDSYCSQQEYDDYYDINHTRPVAEHYDDTAGIAPDKLKVAQALVEGVIRGYINWKEGSLQERKDAIWSAAKHDKLPMAGMAEEWLDELFCAEVDKLITLLIERST